MAKTSVWAAAAALQHPTISVDDLVRLKVMPVSRGLIYDACKSGDIECLRVGKRILVLTAPLRRKLGLDGPASAV
jgi:hypothetical protein